MTVVSLQHRFLHINRSLYKYIYTGLCIYPGLVPYAETKQNAPNISELPSRLRFAPTGVGSDEEKHIKNRHL